MTDFSILAARLLLGMAFVVWGTLKLRGGEAQLVPVLAGMGLPGAKALAYLVGLCELVGGVAVVLGYPVHTVGVLLGVWCLITAYVAHRKDLNQLLSHGAMAGGFFLLAATGPGTLALFGGAPTGVWGLLP